MKVTIAIIDANLFFFYDIMCHHCTMRAVDVFVFQGTILLNVMFH